MDAAAFVGLALGFAVGWPLLPRVPSRLIRWLALGISAAVNAPIAKSTFGIFRM